MQFIQGYSQEILSKITASIINDAQLKFFTPQDLNYEQYYWFICYNNDQIIGVIKTQKSMFHTPEFPFMGFNYISVHKEFQNKRIASQLLEMCFKHFSNNYLMGTDFEDDGTKLIEKMRELAIEYDVYYVDALIRRKLESFPPSKQDIYKLYRSVK